MPQSYDQTSATTPETGLHKKRAHQVPESQPFARLQLAEQTYSRSRGFVYSICPEESKTEMSTRNTFWRKSRNTEERGIRNNSRLTRQKKDQRNRSRLAQERREKKGGDGKNKERERGKWRSRGLRALGLCTNCLNLITDVF